MLSMMNTYKKYSSADNNLEVLYAAYGQKKRTCHTETSPFHIYINLSRGLIFSFAPALSSISTAISRLNASSSSDTGYYPVGLEYELLVHICPLQLRQNPLCLSSGISTFSISPYYTAPSE